MSNEDKMYYIQNGWVGNAALWWAKDSKGYTVDIRLAGKYTFDEAQGIIQRPQDIAWECDHVDNCLDAQKLTINAGYLDISKRMEGKRE